MAKKHYSYHNPNQDNPDENDGETDQKNSERGCNIPCLKFALHLFNVIFFLTGLILVAVGLHTILTKHPSLALLDSGIYTITAHIFMIVGIIILTIALGGCFALCGDSYKRMLTYSILLGVIFFLEAGAGILCYVYRGHLSQELSENLSFKFMQEYGSVNETTVAVDQLQISLSCCGINDFEDWRETRWWQMEERQNNKVPDSCCKTPSPYCGVRDHPSNVYYTGCIDRIERIAGDNLILIGAIALGICLIQLFGTILACILYSKMKALVYHS